VAVGNLRDGGTGCTPRCLEDVSLPERNRQSCRRDALLNTVMAKSTRPNADGNPHNDPA